MQFWTQYEYSNFLDVMRDKPLSYYAFEILYWCGIRERDLLAVTPSNFDFDKGTLSVTKSYQRLNGKDIITEPKAPKSNRIIRMPDFLVEEVKEYIELLYDIQPNDRLFEITKGYLYNEMNRGSKAAGVKRIRIYDLRHSHVSLLIEMGFSDVAISDRVGLESIDITYRYAHLFPDTQGEMANRLNNIKTRR